MERQLVTTREREDAVVAEAEANIDSIRHADKRARRVQAHKMVHKLARGSYKAVFGQAQQSELAATEGVLKQKVQIARKELADKLAERAVLQEEEKAEGARNPEETGKLGKLRDLRKVRKAANIKAVATGARIKRHLLTAPMMQQALLELARKRWDRNPTMERVRSRRDVRALREGAAGAQPSAGGR
jgi:hypothetical protein